MKKRILILIGSVCLAVMVALPVAAGCAAPSPTPAPTPTPTPAPTPTPTPAPSPEATETYTWDWCGCSPFDDPASQGLLEFADLVNERSGGRIKINYHAGGEIVQPSDLLDACGKGVIQGIWSGYGWDTGKTPSFYVASGLPYTAMNRAESLILWGEEGFNELFSKIFAEEYNVFFLCNAPSGRHGLVSNVPVTTAADFKGLKIRAYGSELDLLEELGASALQIPYGEVYTAMQLGTVDGAGVTYMGWDILHFNEVATYLCLPQLTPTNIYMVMNMDLWNSLPEDLQNILQGSSYDWIIYNITHNYRPEEKIFNYLRKNEPERLLEMPLEEQEIVRKAAMRVWDKYKAINPRCAEAVSIVENYLKGVYAID